jgi:hypothetical protein
VLRIESEVFLSCVSRRTLDEVSMESVRGNMIHTNSCSLVCTGAKRFFDVTPALLVHFRPLISLV